MHGYGWTFVTGTIELVVTLILAAIIWPLTAMYMKLCENIVGAEADVAPRTHLLPRLLSPVVLLAAVASAFDSARMCFTAAWTLISGMRLAVLLLFFSPCAWLLFEYITIIGWLAVFAAIYSWIIMTKRAGRLSGPVLLLVGAVLMEVVMSLARDAMWPVTTSSSGRMIMHMGLRLFPRP